MAYKNFENILEKISEVKKRVKSENQDYQTGYLSALSVVEGIIVGEPEVSLMELRALLDECGNKNAVEEYEVAFKKCIIADHNDDAELKVEALNEICLSNLSVEQKKSIGVKLSKEVIGKTYAELSAVCERWEEELRKENEQ